MSRAPLSILVIFGASVFALVLTGRGWILPISFFEPVSAVISALTVVLLLWDNWLWRISLLHPWPVSRPDLTGTWRGEVLRNGEEPITIYLVIKQTFWQIEYRTFTAESRAASVTASLVNTEG